eukprot:TRINITY_DN2604_c0_g1_i5.p4 TRINITY_DN2604_c0_g1~~TRINITY_DN2604_c0_g1_i5.p4  ORF type:complete len:109 (+),score=5.52 TRINITY_DN2604_c0_g1_i5:750-1076(+)
MIARRCAAWFLASTLGSCTVVLVVNPVDERYSMDGDTSSPSLAAGLLALYAASGNSEPTSLGAMMWRIQGDLAGSLRMGSFSAFSFVVASNGPVLHHADGYLASLGRL